MGQWNFDAVFSGTMEEQEVKATRFRSGISQRVKETCARYADAVLAGEDTSMRLEQVRNYEQAHEALVNDQRGVVLKAWIEKRDQDKAAEDLKDAIVGLIVEHRGHK